MPIRKITLARAAGGDDLQFVLSDESKDRFGDVIEAEGWQLGNFKKNPIALFNHDSGFPIGHWQSLRVEGKKLVGKLKLAALGTSDRIDEIIRLVEQGILRAVSVGFQPIEREALKDNSGVLFKRQELLETSLVSVPANPHAIQLARSIGTSDETIGLVFGEQARNTPAPIVRGSMAGTPLPIANQRFAKMKPLSERITERQNELVKLKDQLATHVATIEDESDETATAVTDELTGKVERATQSLESLQRAEATLMTGAAPALPAVSGGGRLPATVARKVAPAEYVLRTAVGLLISKSRNSNGGSCTLEQAIAERYGEDGKIADEQRILMRALTRPEGIHTFDAVQRAAVQPADTGTSGWASQLVETSVQGWMELLLPQSVYPSLSARGLRISFGRSGIISIPTRAATPTVAGAFVLQGNAIPVKQAAFSSQTMSPKKMGVISVFTREIAEHSTPAIEGLVKQAMQEDTSTALDTVLLDNTAATATRPGGIRAGVTVTTASVLTPTFSALVADIKALAGALITASNGNIRAPVWIMNPVQGLSIALTQNAGGDFPFAADINQNRLQGYPVIQSTTVTAGMVILIDAADFVSVEGDAPMFAASDQATLHMDDAPAQIVGPPGPATVATPVRSMFQTDTIALRMLMDVNWMLRRTGVLAWTTGVTW